MLRVAISRRGDGLALRLRYRTDVARRRRRRQDRRLPPHRARADRRRSGRRAPAAEPALRRGARASSSTGSPGRDRELPDRRVHELFEQRVAGAPGRRRGRARRPAVDLPGAQRPRQPAGAGPAGAGAAAAKAVVAVVTERNLDWMAAVLAIFKAGGVAYLPIEPHFPAERIATALSRAECRARADRARQHHHARPGPRLAARGPEALRRRGLRGGPRRREPRRRRRRPTSSPTSSSPPAPPGSPRARCASTRGCSTTSTPRSTTSEIGEGEVVAQTAPQCFDISLWQLVAALLVGGAHPARRAGGDPGRRAVRRHDRRRPGRGAPGRAVLPRGRPVLPGAAPPRAAGPALRVAHRRGAEEGARPALVRRPARDQAGQRLRADRDLGRHQPRGHGPGAGRGPGPARPPHQQRARLRRRRAPDRRCRSAPPA